MKNLIIVFLCLFGITACQQAADTNAPEPAPVDKAKIEQEAGALLDKFYEANKGDKELMQSIIADDAQLFGSDPSEVLDKAGLIKMLDTYQQDAELVSMMESMSFEVTKRLTSVSDDGSQVVVTDQANVSFSKLPVRTTAIIRRKGGDWKIVYSNVAFLIKNEDLEKVDAMFN